MVYYLFLIFIYILTLIWSVIQPHDYFTWFLETTPALIAFIVLIFTYKKFRFSNFVYTLLLLHCIILFIGGHYTYALVPFFDTLKEIFWWTRNNYDKVWHFAQGFVPAAVAFEVFVRQEIVKSGKWQYIFPVLVSLSISAFYELIEWWVSVLTGSAGDAFLWTQWYIWDTQSDMMYALIWSLVFVILFARFHKKILLKK